MTKTCLQIWKKIVLVRSAIHNGFLKINQPGVECSFSKPIINVKLAWYITFDVLFIRSSILPLYYHCNKNIGKAKKIDLRNDLLLFFTTRYLLDRNFTFKTIKSIAFTIIPLHTYSYIIPILYHLYHTYMSWHKTIPSIVVCTLTITYLFYNHYIQFTDLENYVGTYVGMFII